MANSDGVTGVGGRRFSIGLLVPVRERGWAGVGWLSGWWAGAWRRLFGSFLWRYAILYGSATVLRKLGACLNVVSYGGASWVGFACLCVRAGRSLRGVVRLNRSRLRLWGEGGGILRR